MVKPFVPDSLPLGDIEWGSLVRLIGQANAGLARYDGVLQSIPNPSLLLSPMTTQEAVLSSRIEGTQANLTEVLEFQATPNQESIGIQRRDDIQEILNYRIAMEMAVELLEKRPLSLNLFRDVHFTLLDSVRGRDKARGEFRGIQNHIGRPGSTIENARFVPPAPEHLMEHLDNFEKYIHFDEEDRLVQLAIVHAQFEIIHPFLDGNGRVGRILIPLFLYEKKMLSSPTFYLSEYLDKNDTEYREKLLAITSEGDWLGWIQFFLEAIAKQASANTDRAQSILNLYDEMKVKVTESTRSPYAIQILDTIFSQPLFTVSQFAGLANIPRPTATRILNKLSQDDVLQILIRSSGQRPAIFLFDQLIGEVQTSSFND